ncbi:MAG TPA: hypothetical protein VJ725_27720 [Thermoanaerobaculia bacterium]|nr:hypothetical protein [Thermoanaerobaculia bacterium]
MAWGKQKSSGSGCVAWLALAVAVAALVLAWSAYRRTGGELNGLWKGVREDAERSVRGAAEDGSGAVERQADLAKAKAKLLGRRAEVEADRNLEQVRRDVEEIRASLERTYENAGSGARERWRGLDAELAKLETRLKEGSAKAVESLDSAVEKIRGEEEESGDGGKP